MLDAKIDQSVKLDTSIPSTVQSILTMSEETYDHDTMQAVTTDISIDLNYSDIGTLWRPPLNTLCTNGATVSTINPFTTPVISSSTIRIAASIPTPAATAESANTLNIAFEKVIENFEMNSTAEETNNGKDTELGYSEVVESVGDPITAKPKRSMLDIFFRNNKLKSSTKEKKKYDINREFIDSKSDKKVINSSGRVQWNRSISCRKQREIAVRLKINVPHFKRSVIGKNAGNRSIISILSPQPPMWSSLPSIKYTQKDLDQENTQNEPLTEENLSVDKINSSRPKLAISKPGTAISSFHPIPWRPGSAKMSPWKAESKVPSMKINSIHNEDVVKKILSALPPLDSIVSQYESSDVFLHRILKAYQIRCKEIDNSIRLREPTGKRIEIDSKDIDIIEKKRESVANQIPLDTSITSSVRVKFESDPKEVDFTGNKKESMENQILLDTSITSLESSNAHTPTRPYPILPSISSRSPKTQSLLNSHESFPSYSIVHQSSPINSIIESILDNKVVSVSLGQSKSKNSGSVNKKKSKVLSPTKASAASRYQRQFFCADNKAIKD